VSIIESYLAYTANTEKELDEFARLFALLDQNRDGFIEKKELEKALLNGGSSFEEKEVDYVLSKVANQNSGRINYTQFVTMLSDRVKLFGKQSLIQAFEYLDDNSNGFIERSELKRALKNMDCN
jgi:Ca2+-binding EF-hand superfamily protein